MGSNLRLLHTVAGLENEAAGTTICVRRLGEELGRLSVDVRVYSVGSSGPAKANGFLDQRFSQDWARVPVLKAMMFSGSMQRKLAIDSKTADVIHNHGLWLLPNVYCDAIARRQNMPLVMSPHGMLGPGALQFSRLKKTIFWHLFQHTAADGAACWHATSEKEFDDIRASGFKQPIAIVPNGIDIVDLPQIGTSEERRKLLFLGRLHPKKGIDSLLRVWAGLAPQFPNWDLEIVGPVDNSDATKYQNLVRDREIQRVRFLGPLFDAAKTSAYQQADVFVLPTLDENFGMTVAEALVACTPVICSKGAPWSGLKTNHCGWWIDHGDQALAAALRRAMAMPREELSAMGNRGRAWMERDFSWSAVARQMTDVYGWLIRAGDRPSWVRL